jgi:hypothetical protein
LSGGNRPVRLPAVALTVLVALLLHMPPPALAQPAEGMPGNQVDVLLRAFPGGMTPEQADAVLAVMDETELRGAVRPRLLTGPERTGPSTKEIASIAAYTHRIDAVAAAPPHVPGAIADAFARPNGREGAAGLVKVGCGVVVRVDDAQAGERAVGFAAAQAIRGVLEDKGSAH